MKLRNKLLFGVIGLTSIAILPIITTSCSGSSKDEINSFLDKNNALPGISSESNNKLNNLWVPSGENGKLDKSKLGTSLVDKLNSANLQTKTEEEVKRISDDKFNKLNNEKLKEILFNSFNASLQQGEFTNNNAGISRTSLSREQSDIKNVQFNKATSEISFEYIVSKFIQLGVSNNNTSKTFELVRTLSFKFSNIKIESFVRKINWNQKTKLLPSIRISIDQPNATLELLDYKILGDENKYRELAGFVHDLFPNEPDGRPKPPKEEYINEMLNARYSIRYYKKEAEALKKIGNNFGKVDGKFTINENLFNFGNQTSWDYELINALTAVFTTFGFSDEYNSNGNSWVPSAVVTNSSFPYSTIKSNNDIEWEAYNLA